MLSAKPGGMPVVERLAEAFESAGFAIPQIDKRIVFDLADLVSASTEKSELFYSG